MVLLLWSLLSLAIFQAILRESCAFIEFLVLKIFAIAFRLRWIFTSTRNLDVFQAFEGMLCLVISGVADEYSEPRLSTLHLRKLTFKPSPLSDVQVVKVVQHKEHLAWRLVWATLFLNLQNIWPSLVLLNRETAISNAIERLDELVDAFLI